MELEFTVPTHFEADETGNQHDSVVTKMKPIVDHVKVAMHEGQPISKITEDLFDTGLGYFLLFSVFLQATGANIGDLKGFRRWWSDGGLTDSGACDEYASQIELTPLGIDQRHSLLPYK